MPHTNISEILKLRTCCDLYGTRQTVSCGRRNGQPAVFLPPTHEPLTPASPGSDFDEQERFFVNLNPVERETWRKILAAQSIASIAKEEGVERATVYNRILGNSRGQGGMIRKNVWVLLWWRLRQRMTAGAK